MTNPVFVYWPAMTVPSAWQVTLAPTVIRKFRGQPIKGAGWPTGGLSVTSQLKSGTFPVLVTR